jgi:hypothetical protein
MAELTASSQAPAVATRPSNPTELRHFDEAIAATTTESGVERCLRALRSIAGVLVGTLNGVIATWVLRWPDKSMAEVMEHALQRISPLLTA